MQIKIHVIQYPIIIIIIIIIIMSVCGLCVTCGTFACHTGILFQHCPLFLCLQWSFQKDTSKELALNREFPAVCGCHEINWDLTGPRVSYVISIIVQGLVQRHSPVLINQWRLTTLMAHREACRYNIMVTWFVLNNIELLPPVKKYVYIYI